MPMADQEEGRSLSTRTGIFGADRIDFTGVAIWGDMYLTCFA